MNFAKFLRPPFLTEHFQWLFLEHVVEKIVALGKLFPEVTAITKYINSKTSGIYIVITINFEERLKENCAPLIN